MASNCSKNPNLSQTMNAHNLKKYVDKWINGYKGRRNKIGDNLRNNWNDAGLALKKMGKKLFRYLCAYTYYIYSIPKLGFIWKKNWKEADFNWLW